MHICVCVRNVQHVCVCVCVCSNCCIECLVSSCVILCRESFDPSAVFASAEEVSCRSQQDCKGHGPTMRIECMAENKEYTPS